MAEDQSAGIGAQIGSAIKNKLADSLRNMDVLTIIQNIVATPPENEEAEEIREKLQGVLRQYDEMPEDEKVQFANQLKEALATKLQMKLQETPINLTGLDEAISRAIMFKLFLVGAGALLLFMVIVFFGYKLYKSIKDKEKKRQEKKKSKQMKKKK